MHLDKRRLERILRGLVVAVGVLLVLFAPLPNRQDSPAKHTFYIEASAFEYSPAEIRVEPGDTVTLELASTDVVHGLSLDGYDIDLVSDPGQVSSVTFVADQSGVFTMRCSVACGNLHPFMVGKLRVGSNDLLIRSMAAALIALLGGLWGGRW